MDDRLTRIYAGWLSKLVGIRLGAPVEGWTYDRIRREYGTIDGYVCDLSRFAADDDSNGPMIFIRALNDYSLNASAEEIGLTWLNYAPYEHGMFWWGGYGVSTEHTAYLNLANGIMAPRSGSIAQNGATVAEQIGGQIFIDTWGLVFPGNPARAAEYASRAASVSHDGEGRYGGMYVAAAIAMAFDEREIGKIVLGALSYIPQDCAYARAVRAVAAFHAEYPDDWRACYQYVHDFWGYDRYPGNCHIIPNAAVMALSMLYGAGSFDDTLNICCMCGWDTDCNVGNVATILGVMLGLPGIDYEKWLAPINDGFAVSCVVGSLSYMDAPWCARYLYDLAMRLSGAGETGFDPALRRYDFALPGSTHSFEAENARLKHDAGALLCECAGRAEIFRRTYRTPEYFMDDRYQPECAPELFPGQRVTIRARGAGVRARAFARDVSGAVFEGAETALDGAAELFVDIPAGENLCMERAGLICSEGTVFVEEMRFSGAADYAVDCDLLPTEIHHSNYVGIRQFTRFKGILERDGAFLCLSCADRGAAYTGDAQWRDYDFEASFIPASEGACELIVRAQGALRSVSVAIEPEGVLRIYRDDLNRAVLAQTPHAYALGAEYALRVECAGETVRVFENGREILSAGVPDRLRGGVGIGVRRGARVKLRKFAVRPL